MTKDNFRKECKTKLQAQIKKSYTLDKKWLNNIKKITKNYKRILLFLPLNIEPNTKELINFARKFKKDIYVPLTLNRSFKMVSYRLPLKNGQFNIKTCGNSFKLNNKIDLAIVPIIGVDVAFKRIGFGKGFYDRFFGNLNYKPKIVFTQRVLCYCNKTITESFDIKADYIVTSQGFFKKGQVKGVDRITSYRNSISRSQFFSSKKN